jgi:hypothetical protein
MIHFFVTGLIPIIGKSNFLQVVSKTRVAVLQAIIINFTFFNFKNFLIANILE